MSQVHDKLFVPSFPHTSADWHRLQTLVHMCACRTAVPTCNFAHMLCSDATARWSSASKDNAKAVRLLLEKKGDPHFRDQNGKTPRDVAEQRQAESVLKVLELHLMVAAMSSSSKRYALVAVSFLLVCMRQDALLLHGCGGVAAG